MRAQLSEDMMARRLLIGCATLFSVGNLVGSLAPQLMSGAVLRFGVPAGQAGLLILVEGVTLGLGTLLLGTWAPRLTHRSLAIVGMGLFVTSNAVSYWSPSFSVLLAARLVAGMSDAALAFVAVSLVAMRSASPDRSYARMTAATVIYGAFIVGLPPLLLPRITGLAYLPFGAGVSLLLAPLIALLPESTRPSRQQLPLDSERRCTPVVVDPRAKVIFVALLACLVPLCFQSFALFTFTPALGMRIGLSDSHINSVLSVATLACVLGPLAASATSARIGRMLALGTMACIGLAANITFVLTGRPALFDCSLVINLVGCYFVLPLLLAWAADLDSSGRYSSIVMGTLAAVNAASPTLAGMFVDRAGLKILPALVFVTGLVLIGALVVLARLSATALKAAQGQRPGLAGALRVV